MSKTTRYILIAVCIAIFLVGAPLMVMYVSGITYNFQSHQFLETGILAVRTNPSSASVFLDNTRVLTKQGDIKFLAPDEYTVSVQKSGYRNWSKRLSVLTNQVTWANPVPNAITLFYTIQPAQAIATQSKDFLVSGSNIFDISGMSLVVISKAGIHESSYVLPAAADTITPSLDNKYLLLTNSSNSRTVLYFDVEGKKLINLTSIFTTAPILHFTDTGELYAAEGGIVYHINPLMDSQTPLIGDVKDFSIVGDTVYYLQEQNEELSFAIYSLIGGQTQQIVKNLPQFSTDAIFVTNQKQVLLQLDTNLYSVGAGMHLIAQNVQNVSFDPKTPWLLIWHNGELDNYNFNSGSYSFITRTSQPVSNTILRSDLGYAFFFGDKTIQAIELDARDQQNSYSFYTAIAPQKFYLDSTGKTLFILDNGTIKSQVIR